MEETPPLPHPKSLTAFTTGSSPPTFKPCHLPNCPWPCPASPLAPHISFTLRLPRTPAHPQSPPAPGRVEDMANGCVMVTLGAPEAVEGPVAGELAPGLFPMALLE